MKDKLVNCTYVKSILMMCVILGHACAFWSCSWFTGCPVINSTGVNLLFLWLNSFHIYAFVLVSGYIFSFKISFSEYSEGMIETYRVANTEYGRYIPFLKHKARRLLIPYVFSMLFWVAPITEYYYKWDLTYLFNKYIFCINPSQLWFLWMLFGVFVIVWPLINVMMKNHYLGWGIAIACYIIGIIGTKIIPNIFCIWTALQFVIYFFIGIRIRNKEEQGVPLFSNKIPIFAWVFLDILLCYALYTLKWSGIIGKLILAILNLFLHVIGAIMAWTLLQFVAERVNWQDSKLLMKLSNYSMPIYLFHQQIIYFTIVHFNGKVNPWIHVGINFLIALIGAFLICEVLIKWKVTRFLFWGK